MASKRAIRRRSCEGKRQYTQDAAAKAANALKLTAYKCRFGNHWHVGHRPAKVQRAIEERREAA